MVMGDESRGVGIAPLSEDEERAYGLLVEKGRELREPILRRREEERRERSEAAGKKYVGKRRGFACSMGRVPDDVRRWVVMRFAGMSFRKAGEASGASWTRVQEAKAHSEEFRCALAAQEENSRMLMRAKALSVMEQSQEEDARVSLPQAQLAMKILSSLDRDHFGEEREAVRRDGGDEERRICGGGFVINVIGDAASVAAKPSGSSGKAIVYRDV